MTIQGIDVGAKELVVATLHKNDIQKIKKFANNPVGHQKIIQFCSKYLKYGKVTIAMESTGIYYFDLAAALSRTSKFEIKVINPRAVKNFARATMERNKTDNIDAQIIARFAQKMEYPIWEKPSDNALELRQLARSIDSFTKAKARSKNQLHALKSSKSSLNILLETIGNEVEFYESTITKLKQVALSMIESDDRLHQWYSLLRTIKGFGSTSSIQLIGEIISIPEGLTHKQWVAFAGLDPRQFQSGTSINKKVGISKAGNRRMRTGLFFPAITAIRNDIYIRSYYEHLLENRGLKKIQALVAVMRKLIHAIHGMFHQLKGFDSKRFYAGPIKA